MKNISFLINQQGECSLAPAFDVTCSFHPDGAWAATHQMTPNGKRDGFTREVTILSKLPPRGVEALRDHPAVTGMFVGCAMAAHRVLRPGFLERKTRTHRPGICEEVRQDEPDEQDGWL